MNVQDLSDLYAQGSVCFDRGDYAAAITYLEEIVSQARARNESRYELSALRFLSAAWNNMGDYQKKVEVTTRLLRRASQLKDETYVGWAGVRLASALAGLNLRGRWPEIKALLLDGLATTRRLADTELEVEYLRTLGEFAVRMDETDQGLAWLQQALNTIQPNMSKSNANFYRGEVYSSLSRLMRKSDDSAEALRYAELSIGENLELGNPSFIAEGQVTLARAERARGNLDAAQHLLQEVKTQAREKGWRGTEQEAEYVLSMVEQEAGRLEAAESAARSALLLAQEQKLKEEEVECLLSLGQVLQALGHYGEASEVLEEVKHLSQERHYADHFEKAEALLQGEG